MGSSANRLAGFAATRRAAPMAALLVLLAACAGDPSAVSERAGTAPPRVGDVAGALSGGAALDSPVAGTPVQSEGFGAFLAGRHAREVRDMSSAARYALASLQVAPDNALLQREAYAVLVASGQVEAAAEIAEKSLGSAPYSSLPALIVAVASAKAGDYDAAIAAMQPVPRVRLSSLMKPVVMAWLHAGNDRPDEAIRALAPLAQQAALQQLYQFHAGMIFEMAGNAEAAKTHYAKALTLGQGSALRAVELVASFRARHGDQAGAVAAIERFIREQPGSLLVRDVLASIDIADPGPSPIGSPTDGLAESLFSLAASLNDGATADTALMMVQLALYLRPDFPIARLLLADIQEANGQYAAGMDALDGIGPDAPLRYVADLRRARFLERMGRLDESIDLLRQLARERTTLADPLIDLGDVYRMNQRYAESADAYLAAINRVKEVEQHHWVLFYSAGMALERSQNWPLAETKLLRALDLYPDHPLVLNYLGYSWLDKGMNQERADEMIRKAVAQLPNDGYIVDSLGWTLYKRGEYTEAVKQLERAVQLLPLDPTINEHLGDAYWKVGRQDEALFQWQRAIDLGPETPEQEEGLREKLQQGI